MAELILCDTMSILEAIKQTTIPPHLQAGSKRNSMTHMTMADRAMHAPARGSPQLGGLAATDTGAPKRITMWNKRENRKISGNAAPMEKNVDDYLRKHPECEIYSGQRNHMDPAVRAAQLAAEPRITIWNKTERRKVSGNAAPLDCPLIPRNERRDDAVPPENTRVAAVYAIEWFRFS